MLVKEVREETPLKRGPKFPVVGNELRVLERQRMSPEQEGTKVLAR